MRPALGLYPREMAALAPAKSDTRTRFARIAGMSNAPTLALQEFPVHFPSRSVALRKRFGLKPALSATRTIAGAHHEPL